MLTFWHFSAKDKPYQEVLQALKQNKNESFYLSKYNNLISSLSPKLHQEQFQEIMGRLEVFGEAIAQIFT